MSAPTVPQGTPDIAARPHRDTTFPGRFSSASVGVAAPRRAVPAWAPPRPPAAGLPIQVPAQRSAPVPAPAADPTMWGPPPAPPCSSARVFLAVLSRDVHVTGKELVAFLAQNMIQPIFFLFIFAKVLGGAGFVSGDYGEIMLAGLIALNAFFGGLHAVAFPLVMDFAWTREIDDRLLAPMPISLVAVEKMAFGALRGLLAAVLMVPIGLVMLPSVSWPAAAWAPALLCTVLGAVLGGTMGLAIGTLVPPKRINVLFALIFAPLMFTGSVQFPWHALSAERWFQVVCALNPLTYVSEGIRAALVPSVPHLPYLLCVVVSVLATAGFAWLGIAGFMRRAMD
ncbi:MAG: type transport system permease protein [Pseudonocardiales bacterium]|nr:type transport system permease protein [Pseudonocardiales bacterium]